MLLRTAMQGEYLSDQLWWVPFRLGVTRLSPIYPVNGFLIARSRSCMGHEILWLRGRCLVRRMWTWNLCRKTQAKVWQGWRRKVLAHELIRFVGSILMRWVCDVAAVDGQKTVKQGAKGCLALAVGLQILQLNCSKSKFRTF